MPSPESEASERMDALSAAIARLVRVQQENDRRLGEIEKHLGIVAAVAPKPAPAPVPEPVPEPQPSTPPVVETAPEIPAPSPPPVRPPESPGMETNLGLTWVNRIGAVTLTFFAA